MSSLSLLTVDRELFGQRAVCMSRLWSSHDLDQVDDCLTLSDAIMCARSTERRPIKRRFPAAEL